MPKFIELKIKGSAKIYQEVANILCNYKNKPRGSVLFLAEGSLRKPVIVLRYPGRKLRKRVLRVTKTNSALWANLYDFEVVIYQNGKQIPSANFTFQELMKDFYENKKGSKKFWTILEELFKDNTISKVPPKLPGIDSGLLLLVLKWIWIQEDFNYRFGWKEVNSPVPYVLETRTGSRTSKGAGRAKFFAALTLLHSGDFTFEQVKKIIPLY